jgi:DNA invertase Pin-like site-specific DNA recombinase
MIKRCIVWAAVSTKAQATEDKFSLVAQERQGRDLAYREGWQIVDILIVPGHSRYYIDFHELEADAKSKGIDAFSRLRAHWEAKDFDVLIILDRDRFARTQALHAYIAEQVLRHGAVIYSLQDGLVNEDNCRGWIALSGYKTSSDIDRLKKRRDQGMSARAQRGLPVSSQIPISHILIRDTNGKALRMEVNEALRPVFDDLAKLILRGVSWYKIEDELFELGRHTNAKTGQKYYPGFFYRVVTNPLFWGHTARRHNSRDSFNGYKNLPAIFDESLELPDGIEFHWNSHQPVFQGRLGDDVKAEILRRMESVRGNANPANTKLFSGLVICAKCGSFCSTYINGNYKGLRCPSVYSSRNFLPTCENRKILNEKKMIAIVDASIQRMIDLGTPDVFETDENSKEIVREELESLKIQIENTENRLRILVREQSLANDEMQSFYRSEIDKLGETLRGAKHQERESLQRNHENDKTKKEKDDILREIIKMSPENFWLQENRRINQMLHRLLGKNRFLLLDGEIVGVRWSTKRQRRHT